MLRYSLFVCLFGTFNCFCQNDSINQIDLNGAKQGYWVYFGKDRPEEGYPADGKIEAGTYLNDKKSGLWIKYHEDGITPRLKGHYVNNRPYGNYSRYSPEGVLIEDGFFSSNNRIYNRYNSNGQLEKKGVQLRDSDTIYYYRNNGCLDSVEILHAQLGKKKLIRHYSKEGCNIITDSTYTKLYESYLNGDSIKTIFPVSFEITTIDFIDSNNRVNVSCTIRNNSEEDFYYLSNTCYGDKSLIQYDEHVLEYLWRIHCHASFPVVHHIEPNEQITFDMNFRRKIRWEKSITLCLRLIPVEDDTMTREQLYDFLDSLNKDQEKIEICSETIIDNQ